MKDWQDDEYCLYVNGGEGSDLWSLLADWSDSEDERERVKHIPRFARLIACWSRLGFIKVFRSDEWPADHTGEEVTGQELDELLADPQSWEYTEEPTRWICVASGDRDIQELEDGMCEQER
ncbi:hypothetical protein LIX60_03870 [Streptomyces sp. S07_1.15]|uniref:hypothetical protein n=1 Tax=Streptomyces sp. S07_1.15 TaxID=2873925 RepID=UPI001D15A2F5|nr:hypothetical protein [Streptomyces sp. S07_1.15]MCC3650641.1 hypothetical protein [Streptomyces sp. S07_1.15]